MDSLGSSGPESLLYTEYELALKHFINKDFETSFAMASKVYEATLRSFEKGHVLEKTLVRIASLYLTQIGILLPSDSSILAHVKADLISSLQNDELLRKLHDFYGSTARIPHELLYQIFLVYYTCRGLLGESVVGKFKLTYHNLEAEMANLDDENDVYLHKWLDLFILNVLPDSGDFEMAHAILDNVFPKNTSSKGKLRQIESRKVDEAKAASELRDKAAKAEAERLAQRKAHELQQAKEKSLKYMSMKQIRSMHESETIEREPPKENQTAALLDKAKYYYELAKRSLSANSPMILLVLVSLFLANTFLRSRKYNIREKFKETMAMAFKVTYM